MTRFAFQKNCRFEHEDTGYLVQKINPDQASVVAERVHDGQIFCFTIEKLLTSYTEGTLKFIDAIADTEKTLLYKKPITDLRNI